MSGARLVENALAAAAAAEEAVADASPAERAGWLGAVADALDAAAGELIPLAGEETHLAEGRLRGELTRTTFQLRFLAGVAAGGDQLRATVDRADPDWPMGPRPDIRRVHVPLGATLVFAASNFPFAFGVPGGDTAAALAAGCPVVVKAHEGHPRLSDALGRVTAEALAGAGAPAGVFAVVHGREEGVAALKDPRVRAAAFTGSQAGGRALFDIAAARPEPIPFYGELGSINPVYALPAAVAARGAELAAGYAASFSGSAGQLCTKPGLLFLPAGHGLGEPLRAAVAELPGGHRLLTEPIARGFAAGLDERAHVDGVRVLATTGPGTPEAPGATLLETGAATFRAHRELLEAECFGPLSVVVTYDGEDDLLDLAGTVQPSLTATVHADPADDALAARLLRTAARRAGRLVMGGWPTGVTVSAAQQHGGPYPASTAPATTSVGAAAIDRFLRPVAWQSVPEHLLPEPLRTANPWGVRQRTG
ncbi:aldehyde dehydrogenase family protein [Streptomyces sp. MAR4 CNX-425]|uniref:aldehyde dehydrogenase family protein n=1 Tax=Streptomyces sp. MAR4 CNX-425 TaxID=3406343 RepID=UPI003B50F25E